MNIFDKIDALLGYKKETPEEQRARSKELDRIYAGENAKLVSKRQLEDGYDIWERLGTALDKGFHL